ncbi:uncharacterized protein TOT_020001029 [Theileria orientalis strain Shintoku]|uniref:GYF domain-containing protein n=1 Tax=Theileria orientalis strain Shintoku TaxID=869250 RepID=J4DP11_THEOR|nr:uncharacterized protein TOT_020001029 [Theileria orientalis strain Shintoku]BAM39899.1 uncharacterized protein TOT_020001029 [Theileria orientalis strain Shintoku]|eukprot:XP_009690200.1 uncharacterized protein TOT_020001029 [Theileria orientalis strain Shintoku]
MFNPRPSSGISHSFSKSSSKLDSLNRSDAQTLGSVEQSSTQNLQDDAFASSKFRSEFSSLSKRSDDLFRENKTKQTKNLLDFDSSYSSNTNADQAFGSSKPLEIMNDGIYEKSHLLKLMFTFERMSKVNNRKVVSEPLHFHSVDVTSTYNKDQESFYDKNEKMKKLLYKQNPKRTFFDNQTRLLKGVRGLPLKGMYKDEDGDHESPDTDKAFQAFDMRKLGDTLKFDDPTNSAFKDANKEYRAGLTMDLVRQLSREGNVDLSRQFQKRVDANSEVPFAREPGTNDLSKYAREAKVSEMNRLFNAELGTTEMNRAFKAREDLGGDLNKHLPGELASSDLTRHLSHEMSRDPLLESLKSVQHSWELEEQHKGNYMKTNNMLANSGSFTNTYKELQNKDLFKEVFNQSSTYYKDKEQGEKEEGDQSFLERLLDKPFEAAENVDTDVLNFSHNLVDTPRKMWSEVNLQWQYMDPQGMVHGPFSSDQMYHWYLKNFFPQNLRMRYNSKMAWTPFKDLFAANTVPFKSLPRHLLGSANNTSLLGASSSNTNLLAPSNLLGSSSLLNPTANSLLGSASSPGLLGPSAPPASSSLLAPGNGSPVILPPTNSSSSSALMNNRIDNLWNNNQATVHPISSMSNIHMGVSNLQMNTLPHGSKNAMGKHMPAPTQMPAAPALGKQLPAGSQQHPAEALPKQYSASANNLKKQQGFAAPSPSVPASVTTSATSTAARTNERKWNAPQVEVSSLTEIMELEKKSAQERSQKSPPKPVQTGWNLSNVATNNISESDDFPSLSTVATTTSNTNAASASSGKKFGKHITMPLETFIEKHPYTAPPKLTESFSSKLLGNKH